MKILITGKGHKQCEIAEALVVKKVDLLVATNDPASLERLSQLRIQKFSLDPAALSLEQPEINLGREDLIVVTDPDETSLRATLSHLNGQKPPCAVIVFTDQNTRLFTKDFPGFFFKNDRSVYRNEFRDLFRRTATLQKLKALRSLVREAKRVLVVIWGNPDPDAIASAYALGGLLENECKDYVMTYTGDLTRSENIAMVQTLKVPLQKFDPSLITEGTLIATVDAQPSFFRLDHAVPFHIVIDHHPRNESPSSPPRFADIRPTYGATSTILTEYYEHTGENMSKKVATALLYGLKVDTANLSRNVSDADLNSYRILRTRADENMIRTIELSQLPLTTLDVFGLAIARKRIAREVIFSYLGESANPDLCVYVADFFIKLSGISWAIVACRAADKIVVVFRSDGFRKHAGHLAESLFAAFGTAGGHRTMARAELLLEKIPLDAAPRSDERIESWLVTQLGGKLKPLAKA